MTTMPSQVTGHPAPWMDLTPSTIDTTNKFSVCANGSLVIDIAPVAVSDGEVSSDVISSQDGASHEPESRVTKEDVVSPPSDAHVLLVHPKKTSGGKKPMGDVIEIDPVVVEEGLEQEALPKGIEEATIDKDVYVISISDTSEVTVISPDSGNSPKTDRHLKDDSRPLSNSQVMFSCEPEPTGSESAKRRQVNGESSEKSSRGEVLLLGTQSAAQQSSTRDSQRVRAEVWVPSEVRVAAEMTSDGVQRPENHGACRAEKNLDRKLISYLTDFPSRLQTTGADLTNSAPTSVTHQRLTSTASTSDSVRLNSPVPSVVTLAHRVTSASLSAPSLVLGPLSQTVVHVKERKRRRSPVSVIPIHIKEEKVDDSYETSPAMKVQVMDVSRNQDAVTSQGYSIRAPPGNLDCLNPLRSVIVPSATSLPSGKFRTMPTYRFSHFRSTPDPKSVATSGSGSLARFMSLYSQSAPGRPRAHAVATAPANPQYMLANPRRTTPAPIQPKIITTSAPCFILVSKPNPGTPQVATTRATYQIPVPSGSAPSSWEAIPLGNGKGVRPLKVRPANTNAALLTRKFGQLYKRSILPKRIAPKFMPDSLLVSAPPKTLTCDGCGDEFITERGLNDHYSRKSVVISFTCRCDRNVALFYNMCSFARFYERHTSGGSSAHTLKQHSSYDSCVMAMLPPYLMPPEYHRLAKGVESRKKPETATSTLLTCDGSATSVVESSSDASPGAHEQPSPLPSIKEFFTLLESRSADCSECPAVYKRRKGLAGHMCARRSSPKGAELLRCDRCCMVLPNACSFRAHARIHDRVEPYVCPECGQRFRSSRDVFMTHVKKICLHFSRFESRLCPICAAALPDSSETVIAHLESAHVTTQYTCNICAVSFPTDKTFLAHSAAQHGNSATRTEFHQCPVCSVTEKDPVTLAVHLRDHVGEVRFSPRCLFRCLSCLESFGSRPQLVEHVRGAHPEETVGVQMCSICGVQCETGIALYTHNVTEHEEFVRSLARGGDDGVQSTETGSGKSVTTGESVGTIKWLECDRCQMVLSDEALFKRHMAKHRFLEGKRVRARPSEAKKKRRTEKEVAEVKIKAEKIAEEEVPENPSSNELTPVRSSHMPPTSPKMPSTSPKTILTLPKTPLPSPKTPSATRKTPSTSPKTPLTSQKTPSTSPKLPSTSQKMVRQKKPPSDCDGDSKMLWYSCHLCEKTFKSMSDLYQHLKDTHTGKSRLHAYLCWICREQSELKSYQKAGMLIKHFKNFHKIARKNIDYARIASIDDKAEDVAICIEDKPAECGASVVRNLRVEGDATYNCAKCDFASTERDSFLEHIARHRLDDSHQCLECGVCFVVLPSLKRHLFAVHRVRDFDSYQSVTGTSLDLVAEPDSDPDPFVSPSSVDCSLPSVESSSTSPEKESTTLECTVCYRSFVDQWTLRQHMRVHGMAFIQGTRRNNMSGKSPLVDS